MEPDDLISVEADAERSEVSAGDGSPLERKLVEMPAGVELIRRRLDSVVGVRCESGQCR